MGAVYKPLGRRIRVGATFRSAIAPSPDASAPDDSTVFEPTAIRVPWQASFGTAYQFGRRPMNPPLVTAEQRAAATRRPSGEGVEQAEEALRLAYLERPRPYLLVSTELMLLGESPHSVELSSVLHSGEERNESEG